MRAERRGGLTLLEVVVALAILGLGASSWLAVASQGMHSAGISHAREVRLRDASQELARASLWNHAELARRSGTTRSHGLAVQVEAAGTSLWRVSVFDSTGRAPLLSTLVYAPADTNAR